MFEKVFHSGRFYLFHGCDQLIEDFIYLILGEEVRDLSRRKDVVDELQESLVFYLVISEDEGDPGGR